LSPAHCPRANRSPNQHHDPQPACYIVAVPDAMSDVFWSIRKCFELSVFRHVPIPAFLLTPVGDTDPKNPRLVPRLTWRVRPRIGRAATTNHRNGPKPPLGVPVSTSDGLHTSAGLVEASGQRSIVHALDANGCITGFNRATGKASTRREARPSEARALASGHQSSVKWPDLEMMVLLSSISSAVQRAVRNGSRPPPPPPPAPPPPPPPPTPRPPAWDPSPPNDRESTSTPGTIKANFRPTPSRFQGG